MEEGDINPKDISKGEKERPQRLILRFFHLHWRGLILFFFPLVLLPLCFVNTTNDKAYKCLYILILMALFWLTEALPIPVTGMLPICFFPLTGIMSSEDVVALYFKDVIVFFLGGLIMALAIEYSNLHNRLALKVVLIVGCNPIRLHAGLFMLAVFISMWITNSAVVSLMCPIVKAVLEQFEEQGMCKTTRTDVPTKEHEHPLPSKIAMCYYMGIAYGASLGGCCTLIGTATNLVVKAVYDEKFPMAEEKIEFANFMFYSFPPMMVCCLLICLYLQYFYMGLFRPKSKEAQEINYSKDAAIVAKNVIDEKYKQLGRLSCHELSVAILFTTLVILFLTKSPGIFTGWDSFFEVPVKNSSPAVLVVILSFFLPVNYSFLNSLPSKSDEPVKGLISWKYIHEKLPWGLIFMIGAGFALAKGAERSGLAILIGQNLQSLDQLPPLVVLLCVIVFTEFITEFTANSAICNILIPIIMEMCIAIKIHPLFLVLPIGIACSMAFHLPVATPPNAIVASFANIKTKDMLICGIGPTLITTIVLFISCPTWGSVVYRNLDAGLPSWISST